MRMYVGLDIGGKRTAICVIDGSGKAARRGTVDTHSEIIDGVLQRFKGSRRLKALLGARDQLVKLKRVSGARILPTCDI